MTKQEIKQDYLKRHRETLTELITKTQIDPFIHIVAREEGQEKPIIYHIEVPASTDMQKELFARHAIPQLKEDLKKQKVDIIFVTFTTESWVRKMDKDEPVPENWKEIPPDEAVCIFYSDAETESLEFYDIIRDEYEVDENGNLIEKAFEVDAEGNLNKKVEMKYNEEMSTGGINFAGTFSNLYKQLT
jgi:hypothetical protein